MYIKPHVVAGVRYSWPDNKILGSNCVVPLIIVLFDKVVIPETFNEVVKVVLLFNIVVPLTFNVLFTFNPLEFIKALCVFLGPILNVIVPNYCNVNVSVGCEICI